MWIMSVAMEAANTRSPCERTLYSRGMFGYRARSISERTIKDANFFAVTLAPLCLTYPQWTSPVAKLLTNHPLSVCREWSSGNQCLCKAVSQLFRQKLFWRIPNPHIKHPIVTDEGVCIVVARSAGSWTWRIIRPKYGTHTSAIHLLIRTSTISDYLK